MCARTTWFIWTRRIKAFAGSAIRGISPAFPSMISWRELETLNHKNVRYLVSYDGRLGNRSYGKPLPAKLNLTLVEIEAGRSSQATLLGRERNDGGILVSFARAGGGIGSSTHDAPPTAATSKCN